MKTTTRQSFYNWHYRRTLIAMFSYGGIAVAPLRDQEQRAARDLFLGERKDQRMFRDRSRLRDVRLSKTIARPRAVRKRGMTASKSRRKMADLR